MKRNLLFFCYFPNNETNFYIDFNLKMLNYYKNRFTGERHICISLDDLNVDLKKYESYFDFISPDSITFVLNNPETGESVGFIELVNKLKKDNSITFYAHSKNSSKYKETDNTALHNWLFSMYYFNLDDTYIQKTDEYLVSDKIFSGAFRKNIACAPWVTSNWHYSGTFFWFSTNKVMDINGWNMNIDTSNRYSIEAWPGSISNITDSIVSFYENDTNYNLLLQPTWNDILKEIDTFGYKKLYNYILNIMDSNYLTIINKYPSAWIGHNQFAIELVKMLNPNTIVDLGVDYGFSTFSLAYPKIGKVYGVDWFQGDAHAGHRDTYELVMEQYDLLKNEYGISNIEFIKSDFNDLAKKWDIPIDILHIDGLHTYDAVKLDFETWSKFTTENSVILFHDVESFPDSVGKFFNELDGYKLINTGSAGLGVYTLNFTNYSKIKLLCT